MIRLGLSRAAQLWKNAPQPWKAVHVAGTNGKGTICAHVASMLHAAGVKCGRFTSPHLIDRWDCIHVNNEPVSKQLFQQFEHQVLERNNREKIGATPFEILTVTAFEIFTHENVEVGVVETGMGGRDDATNILQHKACTVISNIGLDHQKFLGDSIVDIAKHKCGIFRPSVPVVYDSTNDSSVIQVIKNEAETIGAGQLYPKRALRRALGYEYHTWAKALYYSKPLRVNISCAYGVIEEMLPQLGIPWRQNFLLHRALEQATMHTQLPGRMQKVDLVNLIGGRERKMALLDGAHNLGGVQALDMYVQSSLRTKIKSTRKSTRLAQRSIAWVVAYSKGKDVGAMTKGLIWDTDYVAAVDFGPVDGMPWVESLPSSEVAKTIRGRTEKVEAFGRDIVGALRWAAERAETDWIVVTGSLYLISDVLRTLRDADAREGAVPTENFYSMTLAPDVNFSIGRKSSLTKDEDAAVSMANRRKIFSSFTAKPTIRNRQAKDGLVEAQESAGSA